jgi:carbon-monoxide dehydrogenase small subunit
MKKTITLEVNGVPETADVEVGTTLLRFLRDGLDLTGTKEGCNEGECGSCMVLLDGRPVNSCLVLAVEADGRSVTTVEGLSKDDVLHPLQKAFLSHAAIQCGFCTPGMIVSAAALLREKPDPSEDDVRKALAGNLCRCTGYRQIVDAVHSAAAEMRAAAAVGNGAEAGAGKPVAREEVTA